jgi:hypothetical protein
MWPPSVSSTAQTEILLHNLQKFSRRHLTLSLHGHAGQKPRVRRSLPGPDAGHPLHGGGGHREVSMIRNIRGMISAGREMIDRVQSGRVQEFARLDGRTPEPCACPLHVKPICKPDAPEWDGTGETGQTDCAVLGLVRRGHRIRERPPATGETRVVWLITQRSEVQILPLLSRPEAISRTEKGPLYIVCQLTRPGLAPSRPDGGLPTSYVTAVEAREPPIVRSLAVGDPTVGLQVGPPR